MTESHPGDDDTSSSESQPLRRSPRALPKKSYAALQPAMWKQNLALGQLAIVTFKVGEVVCSVYDSENLELLYRIKPEHFKPTEEEVEDDLSLIFTNNFIAIKREGSPKTKTVLYVINIHPSIATEID